MNKEKELKAGMLVIGLGAGLLIGNTYYERFHPLVMFLAFAFLLIGGTGYFYFSRKN